MEIQQIIHENSCIGDVVIYTNGSILRGVKSSWRFIAKVIGRVITQESLAYETTTSSMRMEVEAVSAAF